MVWIYLVLIFRICGNWKRKDREASAPVKSGGARTTMTTLKRRPESAKDSKAARKIIRNDKVQHIIHRLNLALIDRIDKVLIRNYLEILLHFLFFLTLIGLDFMITFPYLHQFHSFAFVSIFGGWIRPFDLMKSLKRTRDVPVRKSSARGNWSKTFHLLIKRPGEFAWISSKRKRFTLSYLFKDKYEAVPEEDETPRNRVKKKKRQTLKSFTASELSMDMAFVKREHSNPHERVDWNVSQVLKLLWICSGEKCGWRGSPSRLKAQRDWSKFTVYRPILKSLDWHFFFLNLFKRPIPRLVLILEFSQKSRLTIWAFRMTSTSVS